MEPSFMLRLTDSKGIEVGQWELGGEEGFGIPMGEYGMNSLGNDINEIVEKYIIGGIKP